MPGEVGSCSCEKQGCGADEGMLMDGLEPNCAEKKKGGINNSQGLGNQNSSFRFCLKTNGTDTKCWPE